MGKDFNHETIRRAFERAGASVVSLHTLGRGVPDLLIGFAGIDQLVEIKLPARPARRLVGAADLKEKASGRTRLNNRQKGWHHGWCGRPPVIIRNCVEAENLLDALLDALLGVQVL